MDYLINGGFRHRQQQRGHQKTGRMSSLGTECDKLSFVLMEIPPGRQRLPVEILPGRQRLPGKRAVVTTRVVMGTVRGGPPGPRGIAVVVAMR